MAINISPFSDATSSKLGPIELADIAETSTPDSFMFEDIHPAAADAAASNQDTIPYLNSNLLPALDSDFTFEDFEEAEKKRLMIRTWINDV